MAKAGWVMTALVVAFIVGASAAPKFLGLDVALDSMVAIGWSPDYLLLIGVLEVAFVVLYAIPRTGLLGAVLMTALLGGALASHLRADSPLFSHTLFGVYLGVFMWSALLLRDAAFRRYLIGKG